MNTSVAPRAAAPSANTSCSIIKTGRKDGCLAYFHPEKFQLDLKCEDQDETVDLGYSGSRLLERLLARAGEVVSREELMTFAWQDRVVGQGSLNQQIYTLRQLLGDEKQRAIIQTLPRRGYLLSQAALVELPPPAAIEPIAAPTPATSGNRRGLGWAISGLLSGVACALLLGFLLVYPGPEKIRESMTLGDITLTFMGKDQAALERLQRQSASLTQRLTALSEQPLELLVSRDMDYIEVLCRHPQDEDRWIKVHESQLAQVEDELLGSCLG